MELLLYMGKHDSLCDTLTLLVCQLHQQSLECSTSQLNNIILAEEKYDH
jgi:hypothetical protein